MTLMFNDDAVVPKGDHPGDGLIEHMRQHDVIKTADWVVDLGPGGGVNGGRVIAEGVPETIAGVAISATGQYLKPILERARCETEGGGDEAQEGRAVTARQRR